jgi:hypothetical protein
MRHSDVQYYIRYCFLVFPGAVVTGHWQLKQSPSRHWQCQNCFIRDITTDCASQRDTSCLWPTAAARGKWLLLVCIPQGLVSQRSESELLLPPLWNHTLARLCAYKHTRTRLKRWINGESTPLQEIQKKFILARSWIKTVWRKKLKSNFEKLGGQCASLYWGHVTCFAFNWIWLFILNDFQFLGYLSQSNDPLDITICSID